MHQDWGAHADVEVPLVALELDLHASSLQLPGILLRLVTQHIHLQTPWLSAATAGVDLLASPQLTEQD